ncbi:testis-expressed protein 13D-like [Cervus canadensis]|uniref:testis-expressed protein 13D-like n=1 Tax=Cervus canadensis TaxID=1574408 RepID=UPI001CA340C3|nr:testis-expressed protein 13D-like [Cervus canadensis]
MAVNFGDHTSGFRHNDVISFINSEVLMNGGDHDFYTAFRSRSWNEVEDRLRVVIANPQVPHAIKRACAWSALALSVRAGMRRQERQECQIRWLQEQVEEQEKAYWALAFKLQCLREEREEMVSRLRFTQALLQQVLKECDVLRGRLLQVPALAQEMGPGSRAEQFGAVAWPVSTEQQVAMGVPGRPYFEAAADMLRQMPAPEAAVYVPGPPSPWSQVMQPPMPMPMLYPFPYHAPFPMGSQSLPPVPPAEAEAAAVPFQMPSAGVYLPGPLVAMGFQEKIAPPGNKKSYSQGGPEILQGTVPLGGIRSLNQEDGQERLQEMVPLGDSWSHSQEEDPERPQGMISLGTSGSHSQEEVPRRPQGTVPLGDSRNQNQERDLERFQRILPLEYNRSHKQEDPERPQGTDHLGVSRSQSQEGGPERPQATAQGDRWSHDGRENPEKQQPQEQKTEKLKGKEASESHHKEKSASGCSSVNWKCPWCKVMNFPWCKSCYKYRKVCRAVGSGGPDSGQTHRFQEVLVVLNPIVPGCFDGCTILATQDKTENEKKNACYTFAVSSRLRRS